MRDLNDKISGGNLTANEWNDLPSEVQNVIENTAQTLTAADLNQLGKGIAQYIANGDFYTDSGAANAYVLTAIGLKQVSPAYVDGMRVRFIPGNANTIASTVNVGGLGVKNITNTATANRVVASAILELTYKISSGEFEITNIILDNTGAIVIANTLRIFGAGNSGGVYLSQLASNGSVYISRDAENDGADWIARDVQASLLEIQPNGSLKLYYNSGLTAGNSFVPTNVWEVDNSGKQVIGTVPLARLGTVVLDSNTAQAANTTSTVSLSAPLNGNRFYIYTARGQTNNPVNLGGRVQADETVHASPHTIITRASSGVNDLLYLINGSALLMTYTYKIYELTEV